MAIGVASGHDQPGAFPLRDRAEDIGPFGRGRPATARLASACELILHHAGFRTTGTPFGSLARIFASSAGKFFLKASTAARFARSGAPEDLGEASGLQIAPPWIGRRMANAPRATGSLGRPVHPPRRQISPTASTTSACAAVIGVELRTSCPSVRGPKLAAQRE